MLKYILLWIVGSIGLGVLFAGAIVLHDGWQRLRMERRIRRAQRELEHRRAEAIRVWREEQREQSGVAQPADHH